MPLLDIPVPRLRLILADKGYDGDAVREALLHVGILPVIPPKSNRRSPAKCDYRAYKDRNHIERMLNKLKQFRRIATRYDKTARSFLGFLCLAAAKLWLPSFCQQSLVSYAATDRQLKETATSTLQCQGTRRTRQCR